MANVLCITGMHRSGTSLISSWIESSGLRIHNGNLMGSSLSNSRGHFEDWDFVDLHSSIIQTEDPNSHGWKIFEEKFLTFRRNHISNAKKLVNERNAKYEEWGWKDPRSVFFLEQWKEIIPKLKVLFIWRPCYEVVQSLIKRSREEDIIALKITISESVKLWICYNRKVCEYKLKHPNDTLLLYLDYILQHDRRALDLLNKKLQIDLRYEPLNKVYQENLLHRRSELLPQLFCLYYRSYKIEETLRNLTET